MRLSATGRRQKVESGEPIILILNKKRKPAGHHFRDGGRAETHSELASFSSMSISQAAD